MRYSLRLSKEALRDADIIWDGVYEASKSYDIAEKYMDDMMDAMEAKRDFPFSGTPIYYYGLSTGLYYIVFKAYRIIYRVNENAIEVARILLKKQAYLETLFGA